MSGEVRIRKPNAKDGIKMLFARTLFAGMFLYRVLGLTGEVAIGQSALSLEPLKPATPDPMFSKAPYKAVQSLPPLPNGTPVAGGPNSFATAQIELQAIPKFSAPVFARVSSQDSTQEPIAVSPLRPLLDSKVAAAASTKLSVDAMIGPAPDPSQLFHSTQIKPTFLQGAEMMPQLRRQNGMYGELEWTPLGYCWQSPAFCYSPLYFEQPNYERYGQGKGRPFASTVSAAYFVMQTTALPVSMIYNPPWTCECTLGHHRPGNCAPFQRHPEHAQ
jgi:hypothetical protein